MLAKNMLSLKWQNINISNNIINDPTSSHVSNTTTARPYDTNTTMAAITENHQNISSLMNDTIISHNTTDATDVDITTEIAAFVTMLTPNSTLTPSNTLGEIFH